jgi:hypothetical protein
MSLTKYIPKEFYKTIEIPESQQVKHPVVNLQATKWISLQDVEILDIVLLFVKTSLGNHDQSNISINK